MPIEELEISEEEKAVMMDDGPVEEASAEIPATTSKVEAPEVKAEVKAEPKEEAKAEPISQKSLEELERQVVHLKGALKEERDKDRAREADLRTQFLELKTKLTPPEIKPPDPNEDPLGAQQYQIQKLEEEIKTLRSQGEQTTQSVETQNFVRLVDNFEVNFRRQNPDYDAAYKHFAEGKIAEMQEFGITDPEIINKEIGRMSFNISKIAIQNGKNPAEVIYNMAKRQGYKALEVPKPEDTKAKEHLETIAKGQEQASGKLGGGSETDDDITMQSLLKMKEGPEFDKAWTEFWEKHK